MKIMIFLSLSLILSSCNDYKHVRDEAYNKNNPHAKDLLLHGYNRKVDVYIDYETINRALNGDEDCKQIIYSQMDMLKSSPTHVHVFKPF